jgi:hypothetical protein
MKHIEFHVGMKIRVSTWSFLSVVHPLRIPIPMYKKKILGFNKKILTKLAFPPQQKTDTTTQLYCTLGTYVKPKTIFRQNQKTNTTPQLYGTLST